MSTVSDILMKTEYETKGLEKTLMGMREKSHAGWENPLIEGAQSKLEGFVKSLGINLMSGKTQITLMMKNLITKVRTL